MKVGCCFAGVLSVAAVRAFAPAQGLVTAVSRTAFTPASQPANALAAPTQLFRGQGHRCVSMKAAGGDGEPFGSRLLACFPYVLPLLDGVDSGRQVYELVPAVGDAVFAVLGNTLALWNGIPFLSFGVFLAFTFAARNGELPRIVRFNLQQAILVDISLIVLGLLQNVTKGVSPGASDTLSTVEFYFLVSAVGYSLVSNLRGKEPDQIPIISEAAARQIGPF